MFRVLADGEERHLLEDADGTPVGWIHGRIIGFRDLEGEAQVLVAAAAASQALEAVLHREFGSRPQPAPLIERLRFTHDGTSEWIADGARTIARVHRHGAPPGQAASFAIEFELPSYAHEGTAIVAAQLMGRALRAHVGWSRGGEHEARVAPRAQTAARPPTTPVPATPTARLGTSTIIAPA